MVAIFLIHDLMLKRGLQLQNVLFPITSISLAEDE